MGYLKTKNKFDSQIPYHSSEYVACTSSGGLDPNQNIRKRSDLGEGIQMKFEDTEFTVPVEYDKILRSGYGDARRKAYNTPSV